MISNSQHRQRKLRTIQILPDAVISVLHPVASIGRMEYAPVSERLGLPEGEFSNLFQNWSQRLCVRNAFHDVLDKLLHQHVSVRSLEHMNRHTISHPHGW